MVDVTSLLKEEDFQEKCTYCSCSLKDEDWRIVQYNHADYKVIQCSCGRGNKITLDHKNAKHCSWIEREVMNKHRPQKKIQNPTRSLEEHV